MSVKSVEWMGGAVAAFALAIYILGMAFTLMPARAVAEEAGNFAPWIITWAMILGATVIGVLVGSYLIAFGAGKIDKG